MPGYFLLWNVFRSDNSRRRQLALVDDDMTNSGSDTHNASFRFSFMSFRPSPALDNASTDHHDVRAPPPDTEDGQDHYDDDEAMYPTASPPPDESVPRRAGYVFFSLFNSPPGPPIFQSATAHELCCLCNLSQLTPASFARRHTCKHGPTFGYRHAPSPRRHLSPASSPTPLTCSSLVFFGCPRHPRSSRAFLRTCVYLTALRHRNSIYIRFAVARL